MDTATIEARVASGAAWLDEPWPGWERCIDVGRLDLNSDYECVLGQIAHRRIAPKTPFFRACRQLPGLLRDYGFAADLYEPDDDYEVPRIERAWERLIKERFDSGALSDEVPA